MRTKKHVTRKGTTYCLTLVRKAKKDYYNNLDHENVTDNKTFWKSIKLCFSEKDSAHNKITLVEQDLILDKKDNVVEVIDKFFINIVSNLNVPKYHKKSVKRVIVQKKITIGQLVYYLICRKFSKGVFITK